MQNINIFDHVKYYLKQNFFYDRFKPALEEEYRDFKFKDSKIVVITVCISAFFLIIGLWVWDWSVDPLNAMEALPNRILIGLIELIYPITFISTKNRKLLPWVLAVVSLIMETLYVHHLTLLNEGLTYGLTGFVYWFMMSVFSGLSFNIMPTILNIIALALLPNFLVLFGMAGEMPILQYNAMIWPTCMIAMLGSLALDSFYRRLFLYHKDIEKIARIDTLTGISNRFHFNETASKILKLSHRHKHPLSIIMLDIDNFKIINDRYGHLKGDEVLCHVAALLKAKLRDSDLLARFGGEEFVAVLQETNLDGAMKTAEMIRRNISESELNLGNGISVKITISAGVAGYDKLPEDIDLEELIRISDEAMYEAKQAGRNLVVASSKQKDIPLQN